MLGKGPRFSSLPAYHTQMASSPGPWTNSPPLSGFSPPLAQHIILACFCPCFTEVQGWRMACPGPPSRAPKPTAPPVHTGITPRDAPVGWSRWERGAVAGKGFHQKCAPEEGSGDQSRERTPKALGSGAVRIGVKGRGRVSRRHQVLLRAGSVLGAEERAASKVNLVPAPCHLFV